MRLTKHHGLGNDFLVLDDRAGLAPGSAELARAVCDRHRGVGADGLLRLSAGADGFDVTMQLRNADGGVAEMSGNGLACLAQAAVILGAVTGPDVAVRTDAGPRGVRVSATESPTVHEMTVDMGRAVLGEEQPAWVGGAVRRAVTVDVGNPHLVLEVDDPDALDAVDLVTLGEKANASFPHGINVELIAAIPPRSLSPGHTDLSSGATENGLFMRVYERGVGITQACGTGACASAAAASAWGIAGAEVTVQQPGGVATIRVGDPVRMTVPVVHVADIDWLEG